MFSQHDEEKWVAKGLEDVKAPGRFLDIGAADGKKFSNTHALAFRGWTGVCVEPSPKKSAELVMTYLNNQGIQIIVAILDVERRLREFWSETTTDQMVSTTEPSHVRTWSHSASFRKIMVPTITWDDLAALGPYTMINIDTEGTSLVLFDAMPKAMIDAARVIVVEHNGDRRALHVPAGWCQMYDSPENAVLVNGAPR